MNGAADSALCGKAVAIAQTIAEMCYRAEILTASFSCALSIFGRNETTFLIMTITSQLIVAIPAIREHALHKDHSLLSRSLEAWLDDGVCDECWRWAVD